MGLLFGSPGCHGSHHAGTGEALPDLLNSPRHPRLPRPGTFPILTLPHAGQGTGKSPQLPSALGRAHGQDGVTRSWTPTLGGLLVRTVKDQDHKGCCGTYQHPSSFSVIVAWGVTHSTASKNAGVGEILTHQHGISPAQGRLLYTVHYPGLWTVSKTHIFSEFSHYIQKILFIHPSSPRHIDSKLHNVQNSMVYLCLSPAPSVSPAKSLYSVKASTSG